MKEATKCGYADRYKATKAPTCGCDVCRIRWELAQVKIELNKLKGSHEDK